MITPNKIIMPAKSEKQRKFFLLVKAVQTGKVSPKKVGNNVSKAASTISNQDVNDFIKNKTVSKEKLKEMADCLHSLRGIDVRQDTTGTSFSGKGPTEPMNLEENGDNTDPTAERNPIAKTFQQKGNFEQYVDKFSGLEIKPMESESIINYSNGKPTKMDKFSIRYESSDEFSNNTITIIKKLREGNDLVFTAFQINSSSNDDGGQTQGEDDIIVNKSISFKTEIEGGKILADMLAKLEI